MGTTFIAALLVWVVLAILAEIAQFRFFAALRAHEPGAAAPDDAVLSELAERPSRFVSIMVEGTRARVSALFHRSPYPGRAPEAAGPCLGAAHGRRLRLVAVDSGHIGQVTSAHPGAMHLAYARYSSPWNT